MRVAMDHAISAKRHPPCIKHCARQKIAGLQGVSAKIKGGFSFALINPEDSVLKKGMEVTLIPLDDASSIPEDGEKKIITAISFGNKVTAYLEGISDRNIVEAMIPFSIWIPRSVFPQKLEEGEFYLQDLIGLEVFDHESGKKVGEIVSHYDNGIQIILVIGGYKQIELPLVENFFPVIDPENKRVEINMPEEIE